MHIFVLCLLSGVIAIACVDVIQILEGKGGVSALWRLQLQRHDEEGDGDVDLPHQRTAAQPD